MKWISIPILAAVSLSAYAQEIIVMEKPIAARALSGKVSDSTGAALPDVSITLYKCPVHYPHFEAESSATVSAKTNGTGSFSIKNAAIMKPYCIRFRLDGFNQYVIQVHLVRSAPDLQITLRPAA